MAETKKAAEKNPEKAAEKASEAVQEVVDKEVDQGFRGVEVDTTPNEHYTVDGVTSGKPVPEAAKNPAQARAAATSDEAKGLQAEEE